MNLSNKSLARMRSSALLILCLLSLGHSALGQPVQSGKLVELKVPASSLKGNLLGDPAEQRVVIYLPPSYVSSPDKRYPTLYLLHGFTGAIESFTKGFFQEGLQPAVDALIKSGASREMIIVVPNGRNTYLGGFYTNSAAGGNWEDYIYRDLVSYVDANYRTLARAESRGIAGHSMGGYGAMVNAMKHPDVFGAVYALSPCCLGLEGDLSGDNPGWSRAMKVTSADIFKKRPGSFEDFWTVALIASSAAFSPDPNRAPLYVSFPYKEVDRRLVPNEPAFSMFRSKMPLYLVEQYRESLLKLRLIYIDYGQNEEFSHIRITSRMFSDELTSRGIPHIFEVYRDGDHGSRIRERIETRLLPMFSRTLDFGP